MAQGRSRGCMRRERPRESRRGCRKALLRGHREPGRSLCGLGRFAYSNARGDRGDAIARFSGATDEIRQVRGRDQARARTTPAANSSAAPFDLPSRKPAKVPPPCAAPCPTQIKGRCRRLSQIVSQSRPSRPRSASPAPARPRWPSRQPLLRSSPRRGVTPHRRLRPRAEAPVPARAHMARRASRAGPLAASPRKGATGAGSARPVCVWRIARGSRCPPPAPRLGGRATGNGSERNPPPCLLNRSTRCRSTSPSAHRIMDDLSVDLCGGRIPSAANAMSLTPQCSTR